MQLFFEGDDALLEAVARSGGTYPAVVHFEPDGGLSATGRIGGARGQATEAVGVGREGRQARRDGREGNADLSVPCQAPGPERGSIFAYSPA